MMDMHMDMGMVVKSGGTGIGFERSRARSRVCRLRYVSLCALELAIRICSNAFGVIIGIRGRWNVSR